MSNLWNEINKSLWDKDNSIVVTKFCTFADNIGNVVCDLLECFLLLSNLHECIKNNETNY
jgi:hypothetical protein